MFTPSFLMAAGVPEVETITFAGSEVAFTSAYANPAKIVYDTAQNKVVVVYTDGDSNGYVRVGTITGSSISFGAQTSFNSGQSAHVDACYDSANDKIIIIYRDYGNSSYGTAVVGTVSGTGISFGAETVFCSAAVYYNYCSFDTTANKVVVMYLNTVTAQTYSKVGTVSGTGISFGAEATILAGNIQWSSLCYDSYNNKTVVVYGDGNNSYYGTAKVGTVSGTGISFGSATVFNSVRVEYGITTCFDNTNNKVVVVYNDYGNSNYGTAIVGTVSGTGISFGSEAVFMNVGIEYPWCSFDTSNGKAVICYRKPSSGYYGYSLIGSVSGTDITFSSEVVFASASTNYPKCCYDSVDGKTVIAYLDGGNGNYGTAIVGELV